MTQRHAALLWSLLAIALASLMTFVFQSNALAGLAMSTVAVEFCAGKAGAQRTTKAPGWRALFGGLAQGAVLGVVAMLLASRGIQPSAPELSDLLSGLVTALLLAVRSELIEHALIRNLLGGDENAAKPARLVRLALMTLATVAWTYGSGRRVDGYGLLAAGAIGVVTAALWERNGIVAMAARFGFHAFGLALARDLTVSGEAYPKNAWIALVLALGAALAMKSTPSPSAPNVAEQ